MALTQMPVMPLFFLPGRCTRRAACPAWRSVLTRIDPPTYIAGPLRHVVVRRLGISAASGRRPAPGVTRAGRLVPQWLSARIAAIMAIAEFRTTE